MQNSYSDKALTNPADDLFGTKDFAEHIAEGIKKRTSSDCLVLGINGKWGEGKSTALNFIHENLKNDENIKCLKFNPWLFSSPQVLLANFFEQLGNLISDGKPNKKDIKGWLSKYSSIVNLTGVAASVLVPGVGGVLQTILKGLTNSEKIAEEINKNISLDNPQELKDKINEKLIESNQKYVCFIDDIDRLDKEEVFLILKLVKLTADFNNITYVLAFDQEMVAKSVSNKYEDGSIQAGKNYLEKIIQITFELPVLTEEVKKNFIEKLLDDLLERNGIEPLLLCGENDHEKEKRYPTLVDTLCEALSYKSPRFFFRYFNNMNFVIPIIKEKLNVATVFYIELIRHLMPNIFDFMKNNDAFFLKNYRDAVKNTASESEYERLEREKTDYHVKNSQIELEKLLTNDKQNMKISFLVARIMCAVFHPQIVYVHSNSTNKEYAKFFKYSHSHTLAGKSNIHFSGTFHKYFHNYSQVGEE